MVGDLELLRPGDHAALLYQTRAEQFSLVAPFVKSGLGRGERCLYIANDNSVALVLKRLTQVGIDVPSALAKGCLKIVTKRETSETHGKFEPEQMVGDLRRELAEALRLGFSGLRATGEMTWALDDPLALQRLVEYEAVLHRRFSSRLTGLCQYNETRFSPSIISDIIRIHPIIFARGQFVPNRLVAPPEEVLKGSLPPISVHSLFAN